MNVLKTKMIILFIIFQLLNYGCSPAPGSITKVDDNKPADNLILNNEDRTKIKVSKKSKENNYNKS